MMPSDDKLHHPHDKLFKRGFSDPVNAAAFLKGQVPQTLEAAIEWDKLKLESGTFVDSHYKKFESDLLFSAPHANSKCYLHMLFEHQTTLEPMLALRLLRYMTRIWETHLVNEKTAVKLPVVIPIVLAQNGEVWNIDTRFSSLFEVPEEHSEALMPFIPNFAFKLLQLAKVSYEDIYGTPEGILILRLMKRERVDQLLHPAIWDEALLTKISREILGAFVRYILDAEIDKTAFERKLNEIFDPKTQSTAMTLAQQYRQEGEEIGQQKGLQEGIFLALQHAVLEALIVRFDVVPEGLREKIESICDESKLNELHRLAIKSASLEEFSQRL